MLTLTPFQVLAVIAVPHQTDARALAERGIVQRPAFGDKVVVVEIGGGIGPARQMMAAFAVSIYHVRSSPFLSDAPAAEGSYSPHAPYIFHLYDADYRVRS